MKRRHRFAIFRNASHDPFGGCGEIHTCERCHWSFATRGRSLVALDESGDPMCGSESRARMETFDYGPCPGLPNLKALNNASEHPTYARPVRSADTARLRSIVGG